MRIFAGGGTGTGKKRDLGQIHMGLGSPFRAQHMDGWTEGHIDCTGYGSFVCTYFLLVFNV